MFGFNLSYQWLHYTRPSGPPSPVPDSHQRHWIDTPKGRLEVLSNTPSMDGSLNRIPILFCHGGMGCAQVWAEYMQYLALHGVQCYAVSLRGHGGSWYPSYLHMTFATPRSALANDLVAAIEWVQSREDSEVMLVGHSSGGGLCQAILGDGLANVKALGLLGAIPAFGSIDVYRRWWMMDPWFNIRMIFHIWHANSPCSHPKLTRRAFFGDKFPLSEVIHFQRNMSRYESYLWPVSMLLPFATASDILEHIRNDGESGEKVFVMAGTQDKFMIGSMIKKTAQFYRKEKSEVRGGVRLCFVEGAGHHLQNDLQWKDGAEKLLEFYKCI